MIFFEIFSKLHVKYTALLSFYCLSSLNFNVVLASDEFNLCFLLKIICDRIFL